MAEPIRTCLGCRRRRPRRALVRLTVRGAAVAVDPSRDQPGRGAWVCPDEGCAERALRDGGRRLRRALRADAGTVTLEPSALRAAIAALAGDELASARSRDPRREVVAAPSEGRPPSRADASPAPLMQRSGSGMNAPLMQRSGSGVGTGVPT